MTISFMLRESPSPRLVDFVPVPQIEEISATEPDWSREHSVSGRRSPWSRLVSKFAVRRHVFRSTVTGADIPINTKIGGTLRMPHPNGVVRNWDAMIGPNCLIFQQVTIGASQTGVPTIGDDARIGALALVVNDVGRSLTVVAPSAHPINVMSTPGSARNR